ncbi:MAG: DsbA family protein [Actinomycetota bacterium]|nr:DsbA family protein [Actinomycetota bacterium]
MQESAEDEPQAGEDEEQAGADLEHPSLGSEDAPVVLIEYADYQ